MRSRELFFPDESRLQYALSNRLIPSEAQRHAVNALTSNTHTLESLCFVALSLSLSLSLSNAPFLVSYVYVMRCGVLDII